MKKGTIELKIMKKCEFANILLYFLKGYQKVQEN